MVFDFSSCSIELAKVEIKVLNYKLGQGRIVLFFNY